ncbi:replication factor C subunit 3/5 [Puccinia sorghi]|uniref:Replication factor C subunit 5 n=1 Tax=Puccinia sorghi TaxID=27349 RepID=A0A0L6UVV5_9BASI|nr:replication factor C subunit 3/5 [Puccinia sorghi]
MGVRVPVVQALRHDSPRVHCTRHDFAPSSPPAKSRAESPEKTSFEQLDKYRPRTLEELDYHQGLTDRIRALARTADFPHCLFYGPSGAGKKTRIAATLTELFGPGAQKLRIDQKVFVTPSRRRLDVQVVQSNYHLELTPSDVGQWDRSVVQDVLKEVGQSAQLDSSATQRFKVVVIHGADELTNDAQAALRRTMERHTSTMRLILCANSTAKIIGPIRSRCLLLRVGAPNPDQIAQVLNNVSNKASFSTSLPDETAMAIALSSNGNLRRALLTLDAVRAQDATFSKVSRTSPESIPRPDWEVYIDKLAGVIAKEQSPDKLLEARAMLYELLVHLIPPSVVMTHLAKGLLTRVDDALRPEIIHWAAWYEHRLRLGNKPIFHLEAFVAKVMSLYKNYSIGLHDFI